jgi:acyl-coenzyme A synthetase/AMP-(fatty) acid ligase
VEVVHVAGLKVFPAEVEACLATHPDVLEAVVVGAPHPTLGEAPQAFVVPRENSNLSTKDILQFARSRIAGYKLPYVIHLVQSLPRLAGGKPDRGALAKLIVEKKDVERHAPA